VVPIRDKDFERRAKMHARATVDAYLEEKRGKRDGESSSLNEINSSTDGIIERLM
jgi:hypothetical protein